jgi:hypothetical protein
VSKPYSEADFSAIVYGDRTWRIREISDLKSAAKGADAALQQVLLRATVTICYAHWEGHVRSSAKCFMSHITLRRLPFSVLQDNFFKNAILPRLSSTAGPGASVLAKYNFIEDIISSRAGTFKRISDDLINTRSNLNSSVLKDICAVCGLDWDIFEGETDFIDVILLKRRNAVAHGEETFIDVDDLDEVCDRTIGLMRSFSDALENVVYLRTYRK